MRRSQQTWYLSFVSFPRCASSRLYTRAVLGQSSACGMQGAAVLARSAYFRLAACGANATRTLVNGEFIVGGGIPEGQKRQASG
jgi:hypothetical protein